MESGEKRDLQLYESSKGLDDAVAFFHDDGMTDDEIRERFEQALERAKEEE